MDENKNNGTASGSYDEYAGHKAAEPVSPIPALIADAIKRMKDDPGALFEKPVLAAITAERTASAAMYERIRAAAKAAKVPVGRLDKLTVPGDDDDAVTASMFPVVVPWSVPVTAGDLLPQLIAVIYRYVVIDPAALLGVALWTMYAWVYEAFDVSPMAHIHSPEKRCGKSTLLRVMKRVTPRALASSNISPAALYRAIEKWRPTLLMDEVDSFLKDNEAMRGILNGGLDQDQAFVIRSDGDDNHPALFSTWTPKVLCGIGKLADTLEDRSIPVRMRRALPNEKRPRLRHSDPELWMELRSKLARWADDAAYELKQVRVRPVPGLHDRALDCWEPLHAIALMAGGDWPAMAELAAVGLYAPEEEAPTINVELLTDIKEIFDTERVTECFSRDLLNWLNMDKDAPWGTWNRGKEMTVRQLARKLAEFGIRPAGTLRQGYKVARGYRLADFEDAFHRYLTLSFSRKGDSSVTPLQPHNGAVSERFLSVTENGVCRIEKRSQALGHNGCNGVTDEKPEKGAKKNSGANYGDEDDR